MTASLGKRVSWTFVFICTSYHRCHLTHVHSFHCPHFTSHTSLITSPHSHRYVLTVKAKCDRTMHRVTGVLKLVRRLRRWPNLKLALRRCLVSAVVRPWPPRVSATAVLRCPRRRRCDDNLARWFFPGGCKCHRTIMRLGKLGDTSQLCWYIVDPPSPTMGQQ